MSRPSVHSTWLNVAYTLSKRSTCGRRKVGCVLTDEANQVVATGFNGVPSKHPHCIDSPCPGASSPSGTDLDACYAIHAEINAICQLSGKKAHNAYVSCTPCPACAKALVAAGIKRVYVTEFYSDRAGADYCHSMGLEVITI